MKKKFTIFGYTLEQIPLEMPKHEEESVEEKIEMPNFANNPAGPSTYTTVGKEILKNGLEVPTGDETASLLHAAYCSGIEEPEFKEIREIMKRAWLWNFNINLWTPEGVYVVRDSKAEGTSKQLNASDLEKLLDGKEINDVRFSKDREIRFASKETYRLGEHTKDSLAQDGFIIASFGKEGAEKLGEVSAKFKYNPITFGIKVDKGAEQRVSALGGYNGYRLNVYGNLFVDYRYSSAFGVLK